MPTFRAETLWLFLELFEATSNINCDPQCEDSSLIREIHDEIKLAMKTDPGGHRASSYPKHRVEVRKQNISHEREREQTLIELSEASKQLAETASRLNHTSINASGTQQTAGTKRVAPQEWEKSKEVAAFDERCKEFEALRQKLEKLRDPYKKPKIDTNA